MQRCEIKCFLVVFSFSANIIRVAFNLKKRGEIEKSGSDAELEIRSRLHLFTNLGNLSTKMSRVSCPS